MHYHIILFRCNKCTFEQTGHVMCGLSYCMVPCCQCGCTGMYVLDIDEQAYQMPNLVYNGRLFNLTAMPNQVGINELTKRLGIAE
jgi:hypothetical protein